ncbi:MAG: YraN family protein [Clostridia bacterium]|nr:YraN family protein [Clostridia bacterium]
MEKQAHMRGALGEVRAEQELASRGYRILARNYRVRGAEIDLVAEDRDVVVFVEVKLRGGGALGREAVTAAKRRRICRGAMHYMMKNGLTDRQARFDVMEIQGESVTYIEDAFAYQGPAF